MPSEFQMQVPPHAFRIPVQRTPPCPRNSKKPSVVVYGYFLELPNLRDNFLARRNILATNQIARKTIEPFENNNKRSQGHLGEGGPKKN